jgi:hypothetical protein
MRGAAIAGGRQVSPTAAMTANVTDLLWSFDEFYRTVNQYSELARH